MQRRSRRICADRAHIVRNANDKHLREIVGIFVISRARHDGRASHKSPDRARQALRDRVGVIQLRLAARDAKPHAPAWHDPGIPLDGLRAPFELRKTRGAKFSHPYQNAIDRAQMQQGSREHRLGRHERDAATLRGRVGYTEGAEFCSGERLEAGRCDGERIEYHTR